MILADRYYVTPAEYDVLRGLLRLKNRQYEAFLRMYKSSMFRFEKASFSSTFLKALSHLLRNWVAVECMRGGGTGRRLLPQSQSAHWDLQRLEDAGHEFILDMSFFEFLARILEASETGIRRTKEWRPNGFTRVLIRTVLQGMVLNNRQSVVQNIGGLPAMIGWLSLFMPRCDEPQSIELTEASWMAANPDMEVELAHHWLQAYSSQIVTGDYGREAPLMRWLEFGCRTLEQIENLDYGTCLCEGFFRSLKILVEASVFHPRRVFGSANFVENSAMANRRVEVHVALGRFIETLQSWEFRQRGVSFVDEEYELASLQLRLYDQHASGVLKRLQDDLGRYDEPLIQSSGTGSPSGERGGTPSSQSSSTDAAYP